MKNIIKLIISIVICQLAGIVGSFFTSPSIPGWYASLNKPEFNPPNWIFSPVWITLFLLMGISLYIIWSSKIKISYKKTAFIFFGVQLLLNVLWSIIFFGFQAPFYAFIEIILLWFSILITIIVFYRISRPAAYLLVPYILWVSFAAVLNFFIFILN